MLPAVTRSAVSSDAPTGDIPLKIDGSRKSVTSARANARPARLRRPLARPTPIIRAAKTARMMATAGSRL